MRLAGWIVGLPLAVAVVVFAVRNRTPVAVDLWPSGLVVDIPVFALFLGALAGGFLAGSAFVWLAQGRWRRLVRRQRRALRRLEPRTARAGASAPPPTLPAPSGT